ncbi:MAG: TasA family protein [Candidatus Paceibacterota bacterium]|jgi:predicted ribosomally synthesized peptide with SipW-like signal peptide
MSKKRRTSKRHPNKKLFKKALFKVSAVLVCVALNLTGLSAIGNTFAYYTDKVEINGSTLSAGTLDLTVRSDQNNFIPSEVVGDMGPGDSVTRDIYVGKTVDSLPLRYNIGYESIEGSDFCDILQLKIYYNYYGSNSLEYDGLLTSLAGPINGTNGDFIINDGFEQWLHYEISYPASSPVITDQKCVFKFVFNGWQENLPNPSSGFSDTEEISNTLIDSIPEIEVTSGPAADEQPEEEQQGEPEDQDLVIEDPAIIEDPVIEPSQDGENIEDGDIGGQDDTTQDGDNNNDSNTGGGDGEGELTII